MFSRLPSRTFSKTERKTHLHIAALLILFLGGCGASESVCQLPETRLVEEKRCQGTSRLRVEDVKTIVNADQRCQTIEFDIPNGKILRMAFLRHEMT